MNVLIIDIDGLSLSFAWRCVQAGHQVRWFVKPGDEVNPDTGMGFRGIEKINNWVASIKWADLVLLTGNSEYVERLDAFKKRGVPVFAPSVASAKLEIDRKAGMEFMEKIGIEVAPYVTVKSIDEAIKTVKKTEERYVIKTLGDCEDKSLTYVSKSPADMVETLNRWKLEGINPKGDLMLQTFIKGIEVGVSRFMGRDGWVGQWNVSHEFKKMMSGDYGPNTGEQGTIAYFTKNEKLAEETLSKAEKGLMELGHIGDSAIGFIITEEGKYYPTEWTLRPGWPCAQLFLGATEGDPVEWMLDALNGKDTTSFKEDIGCILVMGHKGFPIQKNTIKEVSGYPIYGITRGNKKHIHPYGIQIKPMLDDQDGKIVERPMWNTSEGAVLSVTGFGKDVKQATERAYKTTGQLHVANMMLRDDVGDKLEEELPKLHKLGFCLHCDYEKEVAK